MDNSRVNRLARSWRATARGQSIPLIAFMILVLVAVVGLAVDVGNTYAEQRRVTAATNSAAVAGMDIYIRTGASTTDRQVHEAILNSLRSNGVDIDGDNLDVRATYLGSDGQFVERGSPEVGSMGDVAVPTDTSYIKVEVDGVVDTFFARMVNRDTLPVDANAFAGQCPAGTGVYPLAVDANLIDGERFVDPYNGNGPPNGQQAEFGVVDDVTWRRMNTPTHPGGFSWLAWNDRANNAQDLRIAMQGTGNVLETYQEAPHPNADDGNLSDVPADYPSMPNVISPGDYVHTNTGVTATVWNTEIQGHMEAGTVMTLPIVDEVIGNGNNARYKVLRLGSFMIRDYNVQGQHSWVELYYLGDPRNFTACTTTAVQPQTLGLNGTVALLPAWQTVPEDRQPIQYVVVLDTSGSMNANFLGEGIRNGRVVQCTASSDPVRNEANQNCGNPNNAWNVPEERRIYLAKQAVARLINLMNIAGNAGSNSNFPADMMVILPYDNNASSLPSNPWRADQASNGPWLLDELMDAGSANNDPYLTSGGTNGAAGLYRAWQVLNQNRPTHTELNGTTYEYKTVVIFVTDGVSNQFLDPGRGNLGGGFNGTNTFESGHYCRSISGIAERPECQVNEYADISNMPIRNVNSRITDRPISAMVTVARDRLHDNHLVYSLALSDVPATGLANVAGAPSRFAQVGGTTPDADGDGRSDLEEIFEAINQQVKFGDCEASFASQWVYEIEDENRAGSQYLPGGMPAEAVGYVTLSDSNGVEYTAPIVTNDDGFMTYTFNDLPAGAYTMTSSLFYRHPNDVDGLDGGKAVRVYSKFDRNEERVDEILVEIRPTTNFGGMQQENIRLHLGVDSPCGSGDAIDDLSGR